MSDEENWSLEEKYLFDQFVKEEMEKLERQMATEFQTVTGTPYIEKSPGNAKSESYGKILSKSTGANIIVGQDQWNEAQQKVRSNRTGGSSPQYKLSEEYKGQSSVPSSDHVRMNFNESAQMNEKIRRQQEYSRQLRADQEKNKALITITTAPRRDVYNDGNDARFDRSDSRNSGGYYSNNSSPRGDVSVGGYNKSSLANSSRNIFGGADPTAEAEAKRLKQKKYHDDLMASAAAAPIPVDRQTLRKAQAPSNEGVGLNVGYSSYNSSSSGNSSGNNYNDDRAMRIEQQKKYADQITQASRQAPIASERVRRDRTKDDVGGGSCGYGGADLLSSPSKQVNLRRSTSPTSPRYDYDASSSQPPVSVFPSQREGSAAMREARRQRQQEYSKQLQEDAQRTPLQSPRAALGSRKPHSPATTATLSDPTPGSASALLARGLSNFGPTTSMGQKRAQQQSYASALDQDKTYRATLDTERQDNMTVPTGTTLNNLSSHSSSVVSHRDRQRRYAEELEKDRTAAPIGTGRAPMVRVMSPNSGISRLVPDIYGRHSSNTANNSSSDVSTNQITQQRQAEYVSSGSNVGSGNTSYGFGSAYLNQDKYGPSAGASAVGKFDDSTERRYQQYAERMRQELNMNS